MGDLPSGFAVQLLLPERFGPETALEPFRHFGLLGLYHLPHGCVLTWTHSDPDHLLYSGGALILPAATTLYPDYDQCCRLVDLRLLLL